MKKLSAEIRALEEAAEELNQAIGEVRARRRQQDARHFPVPAPNCRQLAMRAGGEVVFPPGTLDGLDEVMLRGLLESVARKLDTFSASSRTGARRTTRAEPSQANGSASGAGDRLLVADARGEHGAFRLSLFRRYPALTPGEDVPVAIVSLQPECESWGELRQSDFEADEELARLVPALQYMLQNYTGGSTLEQIARTAHLSPFHFHRRFTELLGITPKHYLFDCQVVAAKRLLASGELGLAEIAAHTGFAHQSHFTSRFKQATGLTPTRWRRLLSHSGSAAPSRTRSRGKSAGKRGD